MPTVLGVGPASLPRMRIVLDYLRDMAALGMPPSYARLLDELSLEIESIHNGAYEVRDGKLVFLEVTVKERPPTK